MNERRDLTDVDRMLVHLALAERARLHQEGDRALHEALAAVASAHGAPATAQLVRGTGGGYEAIEWESEPSPAAGAEEEE